jgi:catechol 2,3-dioxygenase-like lactoylglutathione lyase family enzyme
MALDAIGIVSKDIAKSVSFYGLLGVELKEAGGPEHFEGDTPSGVRLMVDHVDLIKKLYPDWQEPTGCGVVLCFKQVSPEGVDTTVTDVNNAGFEVIKEPWDAFWGQRYASVKDPDGNQIDIFARLNT